MPPIDDVALVDFVARRARDIGLVNIHTYAALTKGLGGRELTEMGLLAEAGALGFTDGVARGRRCAGDAPRAVLCPHLRPPRHPASRGAEPQLPAAR